MKPYQLTIAQALEALEARDLSAQELTQSCLARIEQTEAAVGAFITLDPEAAVAAAKRADRARANKEQTGRLCGIPLSLKDLLCTRGVKTTCGSKILANFTPPYDATVVEKIKAEHGIIIGKTSMDEFAMGSTSETCAFNVPRNPWNTEYIAGGSSGGSAASVAAGQVLGSLGSDTGGSIRQPASFCGIVGMKPTYGRVSRYGLVAFASSLDQIGPLARDVTDCALLMNVISGYDQRDSTSVARASEDYTQNLVTTGKGLRVGIPREYFSSSLDPDVDRVVRNSIEKLAALGAEIVEVSLPHIDYCVAAYYLIAPAEASSNLARYDGVSYGYRTEADTLYEMYTKSRSEGFGAEVKRRILIGTHALSSGYYDAYYKKASQVRTLILHDFTEAWKRCDVLVSPVTPSPAWQRGEKKADPLALYLSDILTLSANLAGIPGISVPGGFSSEGLPIGIQIQGPHFHEGAVLQTAFSLEQALALKPSLPPLAQELE